MIFLKLLKMMTMKMINSVIVIIKDDNSLIN